MSGCSSWFHSVIIQFLTVVVFDNIQVHYVKISPLLNVLSRSFLYCLYLFVRGFQNALANIMPLVHQLSFTHLHCFGFVDKCVCLSLSYTYFSSNKWKYSVWIKISSIKQTLCCKPVHTLDFSLLNVAKLLGIPNGITVNQQNPPVDKKYIKSRSWDIVGNCQ